MRPLTISLLACLTALLAAAPASAQTRSVQEVAPVCASAYSDSFEELLILEHEWIAPLAPADKFMDHLKRSPWPLWLHGQVIKVAMCESSHNPDAVGDDGMALGLLQIRTDYHPKLARLNLFDPDINLLAGYVIFLEAGRTWNPWSCKP